MRAEWPHYRSPCESEFMVLNDVDIICSATSFVSMFSVSFTIHLFQWNQSVFLISTTGDPCLEKPAFENTCEN